MKAARLFLVFTGLVLVGSLAVLWQAFGSRSGSTGSVEPPARTRPAPALRPAEPEAGGVRSVYPGLGAARPGQAAGTAPSAPPEPTSGPVAAARPDPAAPAPSEAPAVRQADTATEIVATTGAVDLNTATLDQLNALGAGMIGRTIVANRPYTAPDDLLARRVLNRRDYETIKPHVVVR